MYKPAALLEISAVFPSLHINLNVTTATLTYSHET